MHKNLPTADPRRDSSDTEEPTPSLSWQTEAFIAYTFRCMGEGLLTGDLKEVTCQNVYSSTAEGFTMAA